jgi:hypothetical protein
MSLTTTTTRSTVLLTELLSDVALEPLTPKTVFWPLINQDSIDGGAGLTRKYPKKSDLGAATAATEGVDFTSTTTLSYGTAITATPTEAAVARADITTRAIRRAFPGQPASVVMARILANDFTGLLGVLDDEARSLMRMCYEKVETDCCALLDDAATTVGSTGVDLSVANLLLAIYDLEANEPEHEDFIFVMHPQQTADMRTALLSLSAASSAVWFQQADAGIVNFAGDVSRNGLKGSFLGIPWYQTSPSVNPLPNSGADVAGALLCRGSGLPERGQRGAHVFVEGHAPAFLLDVDPSARTIELMAIWEYAVVEHTDPHYISIVTDAP